jgi:hypothetical protein
MDQPHVQKNWGSQQNLAPTQRRTDPYAFLTASLVLGSMITAASLWVLWRPIPFLELPRGSLTEHALMAGKWLLHLGLPHTFVKDAGWYAAFVASQPVAVKIGMALRMGLSIALGIAPVLLSLVARMRLTARDAMIDIRGAHRFELKEGAKALSQHIARIPNAAPDLSFCDRVAYPSQLWTQHVLVVGGVGAGKSTFMRPLLSRIVASGDRLLCFDPKGEFTAALPSTVIVAPWDKRSYAWDIARVNRPGF